MASMSSVRKGWNSDHVGAKNNIRRDNPTPVPEDDRASEASSKTHVSLPVHGLCIGTTRSSLSDRDAVPDSEDIRRSLLRKADRHLCELDTDNRKLVLRPYGYRHDVMDIAEDLCEQVSGIVPAGETLVPGVRRVEVGDPIETLEEVPRCPNLGANADFFLQHSETRILHRESSVDVRVVATGQFGDVVQKTYLRQTMTPPFRRHASMEDQLLYEVSILTALRGVPGVVHLLGWCKTDTDAGNHRRGGETDPKRRRNCIGGAANGPCQFRSLIYEYVPGNYSPTKPADIHLYIQELLQVLDHLHRKGIVHCNIKRENVIFNGRLTLIDFETAVWEHELIDMGDAGGGQCVTYRSNPYFSAPETLDTQPGRNEHSERRIVLYGHRRDVYGAGVILAELLLKMDTKTHLFRVPHRVHTQEHYLEVRKIFSRDLGGLSGSMHAAYLALKARSNGDFSETKFHKHGADLVKHMTLWSRFERPRAWKALEHTFFEIDPEDTTIEPEPAPGMMTPREMNIPTIKEDEEFITDLEVEQALKATNKVLGHASNQKFGGAFMEMVIVGVKEALQHSDGRALLIKRAKELDEENIPTIKEDEEFIAEIEDEEDAEIEEFIAEIEDEFFQDALNAANKMLIHASNKKLGHASMEMVCRGVMGALRHSDGPALLIKRAKELDKEMDG